MNLRTIYAHQHCGSLGQGSRESISGKLPTYRLITRKSAMMAGWFVVIE